MIRFMGSPAVSVHSHGHQRWGGGEGEGDVLVTDACEVVSL